MTRTFRCLGLFSFSAIVIACLSTDGPRVQAQTKAAPPVLMATYPTLTTLANLGAKKGSTVELTLTGTNLLDATAIWTSFPCTATIPEGQKDATKLKVKFVIPIEATVGFHTIRVATIQGISNLRPFSIDDLPEIEEKPGNNKKETPQPLVVPCVVLGTATAETGDYFRVPVKAGQALTLEAVGRRLGSPIDPVVIVYDAKGREIPGLYADDTPGLQTDARLTHTFPSDGEIIVEIRDTTYRGGADFAYRLRIGSFAGATTAFPLAIERGKKTDVGFAGPGLDGVKPVSVIGGPGIEVQNITPVRAAGQSGWTVPVQIHDHPELIEQEPNNEIAKANALPIPGGISARFAVKNDIDFFRCAGKKGQKLVIQVLTFELNAPTELFLRVLDAKGTELAKSNPQLAGVRLDFAPTVDGDFFISCEQTNYLHGPNEVYHLSVIPVVPDFTVTLGLDRADLPVGGIGLIPITGIVRTNGFAAPVEVTLVGIDGVSGSVTIAAGANPQPTAPLFLPLTTKPGTKPGAFVGQIHAKAVVDGKPVLRIVGSIDNAKAALGAMPNPPQETTTQFAVAITPEAPFTLELKLDKAEVAKGGVFKGKIVAKRADKFTDEIIIAAAHFPVTAVPKLLPIAKAAGEAVIELSIPAALPPGAGVLIFKGTAKVNGKDVTVTAPPVAITVTESVKVEPPKVVPPKK